MLEATTPSARTPSRLMVDGAFHLHRLRLDPQPGREQAAVHHVGAGQLDVTLG